MIRNIKIVSGGQSGVDRAALDFALKNNFCCGGWCPKGRKAEDGRIDEKYPLTETTNDNYETRTKLNIEHSDGTLIFFKKMPDKGTLLTIKFAEEFNKPVLEVNLSGDQKQNLQLVNTWLQLNNFKTLNIAGSRESNNPGIYYKTFKFLEELRKLVNSFLMLL